MSETGGVVQPDGRVVFGPPLRAPAPEKTSAFPFLFACLWVLTMAAAGLLGHYTASGGGSPHEMVRDAFLERGCAPFFAASPASPADESKLRSGVSTFATNQATSGMSDIETGIYEVPEDSPLRLDYPDIVYLGIVTWERCDP